MKKRQLFIICLILTVFSVLVIAKKVYRSHAVSMESATKLGVRFDEKAVQKIEFRKNDGESFVLIKEGGDWKIPSLWNTKADPSKVSRLLDSLRHLKGDLRGNNAAVFADFGIADQESAHLALSGSSGQLVHFVVSMKVPASGGLFIRHANSDSVFLIDDNLFYLMGISGDPESGEVKPNFWARLHVLPLDATQVSGISFREMEKGKERILFEVQKEEAAQPSGAGKAGWISKTDPLPFPIGEEKVFRYLGQIAQAQANEILDPSGSYGLDAPDSVLAIRFSDGSEKNLNMKKAGEKESDGYNVLGLDGESVFRLSAGTWRSFRAEPSYFMSTIPFAGESGTWVAIRAKSPSGSVYLTKETTPDGSATWKMEGASEQSKQETLVQYVDAIQNFSIERFLSESGTKAPKDADEVWFEVEPASGEAVRIGLSPDADPSGFHTAIRQGYVTVFYVSQPAYDNITQLPK